MAGRLELDGHQSPFQPKPFHDSMLSCFSLQQNAYITSTPDGCVYNRLRKDTGRNSMQGICSNVHGPKSKIHASQIIVPGAGWLWDSREILTHSEGARMLS